MIRFLAVLLFLFSGIAAAQSWPARPVKVIVPFAPGGSADTLGRIVAQKLGEQLKQSFVVENRAGAGGAIGSELVSNAAPDGYTLLVSGIASHVIAPQLPQGTPYDPVRDFTHIALFGGPPAVLAVHPSVQAKDLREFVAAREVEAGTAFLRLAGQRHAGPARGRAVQAARRHRHRQHVPYKGASAR